MPTAALVTGILAILIAIFCTAPCFMWLGGALGLPVAVVGILTSIAGLFQQARAKYRDEDANEVKLALSGLALSTIAALWIGLNLMVRGPL